jgi:hypothetical protein
MGGISSAAQLSFMSSTIATEISNKQNYGFLGSTF